MNKSLKQCGKAGFTLAEILMAMMVFAIAITTILGLLARSIETADSILIKDEAISLSSAVDSFMTGLPFTTAYGAVREDVSLYTYHYRADPSSIRAADGTLEPKSVLGTNDQLGVNYVVVSGVRPSTDPELPNDIAALEGRLFEVKLSVSDANPYTGATLPVNPDAAGGPNGFPAYDQAVLVILADFYNVATTQVAADPTSVDPVFSFTFAVRR